MSIRDRAVLMAVVAMVLLAACGVGDGQVQSRGEVATEPAAPSAARFAALVRSPDVDYTPKTSMVELASMVDVVSVGTLRNPRSGRAVYGSADDPLPSFRTVIFDLTEVEVLGGQRPDLLTGDVVVEMMAPNPMLGDDGLAEVKDALPQDQRGIFFLSVYDPTEKTTVKGEDASLTYLFPHSQGVALETPSGPVITLNDPLPGSNPTEFVPLIDVARVELNQARALPATDG